jgi:hypothetical protein
MVEKVQKNQLKQKQPTTATPAVARASRTCSMRHLHRTVRRLRDSCGAGLCGVAMPIEHVMIVQLV